MFLNARDCVTKLKMKTRAKRDVSVLVLVSFKAHLKTKTATCLALYHRFITIVTNVVWHVYFL